MNRGHWHVAMFPGEDLETKKSTKDPLMNTAPKSEIYLINSNGFTFWCYHTAMVQMFLIAKIVRGRRLLHELEQQEKDQIVLEAAQAASTRFKAGNKKLEDEPRSGRPTAISFDELKNLAEQHPYEGIIAQSTSDCAMNGASVFKRNSEVMGLLDLTAAQLLGYVADREKTGIENEPMPSLRRSWSEGADSLFLRCQSFQNSVRPEACKQVTVEYKRCSWETSPKIEKPRFHSMGFV
ncbi:hypothetical protein NECAME_12906 [Necator americanus]|uniref:Uncharacterized protein n=1 Tax=Necator americanus TaxID=51031 RepID=W2SYE7_NECAM|nr:hypothetical protein NECAME_12906 [Necator americanus]ETN74563.1 hypothetical protein NECAME_12906 [Necator americanus]